MTTLRQARQIVKGLGMTLRVIDGEEYRVAYIPDREASAYYTNDLDDAVGTARAMHAHRSKSGRTPKQEKIVRTIEAQGFVTADQIVSYIKGKA